MQPKDDVRNMYDKDGKLTEIGHQQIVHLIMTHEDNIGVLKSRPCEVLRNWSNETLAGTLYILFQMVVDALVARDNRIQEGIKTLQDVKGHLNDDKLTSDLESYIKGEPMDDTTIILLAHFRMIAAHYKYVNPGRFIFAV